MTRCDVHPRRRAVRTIRDAANVAHLCCAECVREIARMLTTPAR